MLMIYYMKMIFSNNNNMMMLFYHHLILLLPNLLLYHDIKTQNIKSKKQKFSSVHEDIRVHWRVKTYPFSTPTNDFATKCRELFKFKDGSLPPFHKYRISQILNFHLHIRTLHVEYCKEIN